MSEESHVAEHCIFALSDSTDTDFKQQCNHNHDERCDQCKTLTATLSSIEKELVEASYPSDEDRDETLYLFYNAQRSIQTWKCHQLRSVRQDKAQLDVLDLLDDESVLIVNDWAMKFLPQMYRESLSD